MADPALVPARAARGTRGAVVAPHHLATQAGLAVLAAGGHAVDAAIATNAVLAVVQPNGCGLGGDAFWLVWDEAAGELVALNGSGRSPAAADAEALRDHGLERIPLRGPLGITVPGAVRSWSDAHRRWGRLPRERVLAEAIAQAEGGFPAWDGLVDAVERTAASVGDAPWAGGFHETWRPGGRSRRPGERIRLPALASTLATLARDGFDAYYEGQIGEWLVTTLERAGAAITVEDFRAQASTWGAAIDTTYRGVRVATHPPNSSGIVALDILGVLSRIAPPGGATFVGRGWSDPAWLHLQLEAAKLAYADRDAWLTDPSVREVDVGRFLDPSHAADLAARIDPARALADPEPARTLVGGTIYLATVDAEGNAVSLIQSNAAGFGSGVLCATTGVHFQNRGASFSLDPSSPNVLEPRKRPAHTLMPAMWFRDGEARPWVVAGSMGGDIQPQIHVQLVSAVVDGGADLATAVAAPRVVVAPDGYLAPPVAVRADGELAPGVAEGLLARGHRLSSAPFDGTLGHEHAIEMIDGGPAAGGTLLATTDPRSSGLPAVR